MRAREVEAARGFGRALQPDWRGEGRPRGLVHRPSPGLHRSFWGSHVGDDLAARRNGAEASREGRASRPPSSPLSSSAGRAAILIWKPLRWFLSHQGAWSRPQGGALGRGCWWWSRREPETIFNAPRLLEACPANMEAARKWLQACEAQGGLLPRQK